MKNARLLQLLGMILASSTMGARGLACIGNCQDRSEYSVIPILPASSGENGGPAPADSTESLCALHCPHADSCKPMTISQADGNNIQALECSSHHTCGAGRRPSGLAEANMADGTALQQWFAQSAHLEAASVDAFGQMRRALRAYGAPRMFLRQASRAAREEKRHARRMRALAKRAGAIAPVPVVAKTPVPPLEELVCQNAIEGGLRETFGALVALYQSQHAQNREVAAAMQKIAKEEAHHAAFSLRLDAWARRRLGPDANHRIDLETRAAARELLQDANSVADFETRRALGLPDACTSNTLAKLLLQKLHVSFDKLSLPL